MERLNRAEEGDAAFHTSVISSEGQKIKHFMKKSDNHWSTETVMTLAQASTDMEEKKGGSMSDGVRHVKFKVAL